MFTVLLVVAIEILMGVFFLVGWFCCKTHTSYSQPTKVSPVVIPELNMDPVSPEDQRLFEKLERESRKYAFKKEEE